MSELKEIFTVTVFFCNIILQCENYIYALGQLKFSIIEKVKKKIKEEISENASRKLKMRI